VFGVPVSKQEHPELRERAKAINFGLVYGMGAAGLARTSTPDLRTAQELLAKYFHTFPRSAPSSRPRRARPWRAVTP